MNVHMYIVGNHKESGVDFTKSRKFKINRKCYRKCDFQAIDWLKITLTTDLRLTTFCEIDHWSFDWVIKYMVFIQHNEVHHFH
jgi:uncharacterized protein (DUF2342 family)